MSFAENLQYLRKQKNITQEQLAEQLEVSRQSVSKWESAQSYPEMEKLLQICKMFHCSMDTLMQGDISREFMEDTCGYDRFRNQFSKWVSIGVGIILLGLSIMMMLSETPVGEMTAAAVFFAFMIVGVLILVVKGMEYSRFLQKHPQIEDFYTEEQKEEADKAFTVRIAVGVGAILVGVLFFMIAGDRIETLTTADAARIELLESVAGGIFMLVITVAVSILAYGGMQKDKYDIAGYNREANPSPEKKKRDALKGKLCTCIILIATIIYLILGFTKSGWASAPVVYSVAGIFCAITAVVLSKEEQ